jgi:rod shape-determining protein MreC
MMGKVFAILERHWYSALFLVLLGGGVAMLFSRGEQPAESGALQRALLEVSGPFQQGITKGIGFFEGIWHRYVYLVHLEEENRLLREIIEEMKRERIQLLEFQGENSRLRSLLGFKKDFQKPLLPAEVIGKDLSGWFQTVVIDRGTRDGIEEGMAVVSVQGVVGQIMESSKSFARVLLITDPNSAVAALVQRTRARGIVKGNGRQMCRLEYLHRSDEVEPGDLILSSGLDGVYPKGVPIGTVLKAEKRDPELFQRVEILPSADFRRLEDVMVLCDKRNLEETDRP